MMAPFHSFTYSSGFILNDPLLEREVLYVRYRTDLVGCLRQAFPDRAFYRVEAENGAETLRPLSAGDLVPPAVTD